MSKTDRIYGLDLMRFCAIFSVLFSHTLYIAIVPDFPKLEFVAALLGFIGVEVFFVLSGFLIGGILLEKLDKKIYLVALKHFWLRRWFRTFPNYYLFLLINILLFVRDFTDITPIWRYFFFFQNFFSESRKFYPESWSLAIEEWFYVLFPIIILLLSKIWPHKTFKYNFAFAAISLLAIITLARTLYIIMALPKWDLELRHVLVYRLDAPIYGVIAAFLQKFYAIYWNKKTTSYLTFALILFFIGLYFFKAISTNQESDTIALILIFPCYSLAFSLLLPQLSDWRTQTTFISKWIERISIWSYSLYLCHLPLGSFFKKYIFINSSNIIITITGMLLYVSSSIILAGVIFRYFETKLTNLRERF